MTLPNVSLLPGAVADILASVSESGKLNLGDRYGLLAATLDDHLPEDERRAVNRIIHAVARGKVTVTTDI